MNIGGRKPEILEVDVTEGSVATTSAGDKVVPLRKKLVDSEGFGCVAVDIYSGRGVIVRLGWATLAGS